MVDRTFAVVTDSGADLPASLAEELGIRVVPLSIHFGDEVFKDGVTLPAEPFYQRLTTDKERPPHTSQPSPGDFQQVYESLREAGVKQVLSIHLASKLSGTLQSATIAAREIDRKSTRLNSSHVKISYAVFCLKKKIHPVQVVSLPDPVILGG